MYLKSLKIINFRKFTTKNNEIEFVDASNYQEHMKGKEINVAPTTTLIVGKNNSGKTTIVNGLEKLLNKQAFNANDFNFAYLKKLLEQYENPPKEIETPYLQFNIGIGIEDTSNDLISNIIPFMKLEDVNQSELEILVKVELEDEEIFNRDVKNILSKYTGLDRFGNFLQLINDSKFKVNYYNASGEVISRNFSINKLIELRAIKANNIEHEMSLSKAFSKIIEYRYNALFGEEVDNLDSHINLINEDLTRLIEDKHTKDINQSLEQIESREKLQVLLRADLTFKKLMNDLIKYEYVEKSMNIPENQFGLGYTKLMMIIADLIDYMEKYPEDSFNSKVNLISIEEPETFMHPQMQELFIKNINETIGSLLKSKNKNVNSQLIITTHSSHILNSKIHSGNTFNNINYITVIDNHTNVVNLHDDIVIPKDGSLNNKKRDKDLNFLKKHIKYKVSELFFSDAVIFVEGITEETLLKYFIDKNENLNKYYISIFNIDGSHGLVYHNLIKLLRVPSLIITDLDIKRNQTEKDDFIQISDLKDRLTTNETIKKYNADSHKLDSIPKYFEVDNMYIAFQTEVNGYYPTSFEEAFILTNYNNVFLNSVLKKIKPNIYKDIIKKDKRFKNIKDNSYKLQRKLTNSKSDFANELLYKLITDAEYMIIPTLPDYIENGIKWLTKKLEGDTQ